MLIQDSQDYGAEDQPLLMETIGAVTERAARLWPENDALVVRQQGVRLSYFQLNERVVGLCQSKLA